MLFCKHRSWSYHNNLLSIVNRFECSSHRNFRFPISDISTHNSVHYLRIFHILFHIIYGISLIFCFFKWKIRLKFLLPHSILLIHKTILALSSCLYFDKFRRKFLNIFFEFFPFSFKSTCSQPK